MKPVKLTEREYATPIVGGGALPIMNYTADLGLPIEALIVVALTSCFYSGMRMWVKVKAMQYANRCGSCEEPVPVKPEKPEPATP